MNVELIKKSENFSTSNIIKEKDLVIIKRGSFLKSCIIKDRPQRMGRSRESQMTLNLYEVVNNPYGAQFKMISLPKKGKNFKTHLLELNEGLVVDLLDFGDESGFDNRNVCSNGQSQNLSKEEIHELQDSGKSGSEVVQTLVENNKTFNMKTKFSQEKYISKKQKKYDDYITIHRPTIRMLAHMFYQNDPLRICNLRIDTLSQMMSYSNVQSGGNFAVYECGINGLVSAAMLDRMGSEGNLVHVHSGEAPHKEAVDMMNFNEETQKILSFIGAEKLPEFSFENEEQFLELQKRLAPTDDWKSKEEEITKSLDESNSSEISKPVQRRKYCRPKIEDLKKSMLVLAEGLHGFTVACKQHPSSITLALLSYLKPGHSFVVFAPYKEALMELFVDLKKENCVNIRIVENWLRNYQVLPDRTHPEMTMSGGGGYLLSGWKVDSV